MKPLAAFALALGLVLLGAATPAASAQNYTVNLVNNSGLDPAEYTFYVMGFSYNSNLVLGPAGTLISQNSGTVSSYPVGSGSGQISQITLDSATAFTGGRFYFFVVPTGDPAPSVAYNTQPANPPGGDNIYGIVELTIPANAASTIDVQTVDGFTVPLTITLNNNINVAGQQYGQPIYSTGQSAIVNREAIFTAYNSFMQAEGTAGTPYLDLVYGAGTVAGQAAGILNPYAYLSEVTGTNAYANLDSALNGVFDADLTTLFGTATLSVQGVASGASDSGTPIPADIYTSSVVASQTYPGTSVTLPALKFTGTNNPGNVFYVYNPVGLTVTTDSSGDQIVGSISDSTLTLNTTVNGLQVGMYVLGAGVPTPSGQSATTITAINGNVLTLSQSLGTPAANSQYLFCKLPFTSMFVTTGQMVFGNTGVFADNTLQFAAGSASATVLGNLENQLVSALNRGVGVAAGALSPGTSGGTSAYWGDQRNWYPSSGVQNLFSLFMHAGQISGTPIFFLPANAANWPNARGQVMGSAYGFGFDENGGPVPPAPSGQPEVPSKFDQNVPVGATIQVTFGPWTGTQPPAPVPAPKVKVDGKKTIKTTKKQIKIKGTAVGQKLYVKYPKKSGGTAKKQIKISGSGKWTFTFKPQRKNTTLQFWAVASNGQKSSTQKIKVVDKDK